MPILSTNQDLDIDIDIEDVLNIIDDLTDYQIKNNLLPHLVNQGYIKDFEISASAGGDATSHVTLMRDKLNGLTKFVYHFTKDEDQFLESMFRKYL